MHNCQNIQFKISSVRSVISRCQLYLLTVQFLNEVRTGYTSYFHDLSQLIHVWESRVKVKVTQAQHIHVHIGSVSKQFQQKPCHRLPFSHNCTAHAIANSSYYLFSCLYCLYCTLLGDRSVGYAAAHTVWDDTNHRWVCHPFIRRP